MRYAKVRLSVAVVICLGLPAGIHAAGVDHLQQTLETDKGVYFLGEQVHITYVLSNPTDSSVSIWIPGGYWLHLWVLDDGVPIIDLAEGLGIASFYKETLAPGEVRQVDRSWDMIEWDWINGVRIPVDPGVYEICACVNSTSGYPAPIQKPITIIPEPVVLMYLLAWALPCRRKRRILRFDR